MGEAERPRPSVVVDHGGRQSGLAVVWRSTSPSPRSWRRSRSTTTWARPSVDLTVARPWGEVGRPPRDQVDGHGGGQTASPHGYRGRSVSPHGWRRI
ncbi:hypothetical protein NL676_024714 [Syzygium grande]|nr:hypothetical protein NL676_024714 [Syzygium grande]